MLTTEVPKLETQMTKYRWRVVALLFFATTINYLDRQVLGLLKPALEADFAWTEKDFSKRSFNSR